MSREPWSRDQRWMGASAGISKPKNSKVQRDLVVARPIHFSTSSFEYRLNQSLPNCICPFHLHETIQCCDRALDFALALIYFRISPDLLNRSRNSCTTQTFCTRRHHRVVHIVQPTSIQAESLSTAGFGGIAPACTATTRNGTAKDRRLECNREHMHGMSAYQSSTTKHANQLPVCSRPVSGVIKLVSLLPAFL